MTNPMPWFETLTDSVYALGAAAREAQRAARTAELAREAYDLDRLRPVDGEVRLDGRDPSSVPFRPHDAALFTIGDALMEQANKLRTLYTQAAEGYAYGTAWAICEDAGLFAEYLDERPQLSDHEAGELHEAIDTATGAPDAAYAYGQLAESALHFALLEPRAQHARTGKEQ